MIQPLTGKENIPNWNKLRPIATFYDLQLFQLIMTNACLLNVFLIVCIM
jgi:hypothetical protein